MTGRREIPEVGPDSAVDEVAPARGRRFARLVESPVSRRVALPRLLVAAGLVLATAALAWIGVAKLLGSAARFVHRRPENQIKFAEIELSPPPDPWINDGKALILEEVRQGGDLGESVPLLELDLEALAKDFRRCAWVKDVRRVDRSHHGRLVVDLNYRRPVAVVPFERLKPFAFVLDDEAVVLPDREIAWKVNNDPYHVRGMAAPLIKILGLPDNSPPPTFGLPWKRKVEAESLDDRDPMVLKAARLARFLQDRRAALKGPREAPDFVAIHLPQGPDHPFFLLDSGENWVSWGAAPGDEKAGLPSSEARWGMLLGWVQAHGPLVARYPDCLEFTPGGARIRPGRPSGGRSRDEGGSGRSGRPTSR